MDIYVKNSAGTFNRKKVNHIKSLSDVKEELHGKNHFFATAFTAKVVAMNMSNTLFSYLSPVYTSEGVRYVFTNNPIY